MGRLTMTSDKGGLAFTFDLDITCERSEIEKTVKLGEKLKEYEDLEEKDLLVKLPCKVGDMIWTNNFGKTFPYKITHFSFEGINSNELFIHYENLNGSIQGSFPTSLIGEEIFLTKKEAEQALREMEEQNETN